jgi:hypothetical protein
MRKTALLLTLAALLATPTLAAPVKWAIDGWAVRMLDGHSYMVAPKSCTVGPLPAHDVKEVTPREMSRVAKASGDANTDGILGFTAYPPVVPRPTILLLKSLPGKHGPADRSVYFDIKQHEEAHLRGCRHDYDANHSSWLLEVLIRG